MFEDISRVKPRIGRKSSGGKFDFSVRPLRPAVDGNAPMLWPSGRPLPREEVSARKRPVRMAVKRGFDAGLALLALAALSVPLVVIFVVLRHRLVAIPTRGPNGKTFGRLNFDLDGIGSRALRETGLDRLPELFNVLRGDMSLIGPPPGCDGTPLVRPGLAGSAQTTDGHFSLLGDFRIFVSILSGRQR